MLINILVPDFKFNDNRGTLTQLVRSGYKQINVITSVEDSLRGGHYHKENEEAFFIINGELELEVYKLDEKNKSEKYIFGEGDMFQIPRDIVHSFYFKKQTLLVSMYSNGVELASGEKDILTI